MAPPAPASRCSTRPSTATGDNVVWETEEEAAVQAFFAATAACGSRRPRRAGRASRAACSATRVEDGRPALEAAPAAARLGTALRAVRMQRNLSQSELARLLGISPSAVSQAERGRRGLSLETLLDACTKLDLTLDELLRGDVNPGYRLARRHDPAPACGRARPWRCRRSPAGLRAYLLTLAPRGQATPHLTHEGVGWRRPAVWTRRWRGPLGAVPRT